MRERLSSLEREPRAARLARETCVLPPAVAEFDRALLTWLGSFATIEDAASPAIAPYLRPVVATSAEDEGLEASIARLAGPARVYAWARLWKAFDRLHDAGLGLGGVGHGLARHLVEARPGRLSRETMLALHRYFEDIDDSPTSGLYHALWDRTRASGLLRRRAGASRDEALASFVKLLERRSHHHQLVDLRRVLHAVRREDDRATHALRGFEPQNDQSTALFAGEVIRTVGIRTHDRRPGAAAARVMRWFFAGRPRPTAAWVAARYDLARTLGEDTIARLARWVRARGERAEAADAGEGDPLFAVASRTSTWLLGAAR